jgi:hypothetical protein
VIDQEASYTQCPRGLEGYDGFIHGDMTGRQHQVCRRNLLEHLVPPVIQTTVWAYRNRSEAKIAMNTQLSVLACALVTLGRNRWQPDNSGSEQVSHSHSVRVRTPYRAVQDNSTDRTVLGK